MVPHPGPLLHPQDHRPSLAIIGVQRPLCTEQRPEWWVALANLRMVFNSATNAVAAAALTQGPPDAAQRDPRSLMIWSRIRIADL